MMKSKQLVTNKQPRINDFTVVAEELPYTWERIIPKQTANDPASRRILNFHLQRYKTAAQYVSGKRVLDIACGTGYGCEMLSLAGANTIVGVDVCLQTIQYAQKHYQSPNIEFICTDAEQFESSEQFDVVVSFETLEHLQEPAEFLNRIRSLLVPEGKFLLSVPLGETRHLDRHHLHAFSQKEIFRLLEAAGFEVTQSQCDDCFMNRAELLALKRLYPVAAKLSLYEQYFTRRGWQLLRDFIFHGGVPFTQLLVVARLDRALTKGVAEGKDD